MRKKGLLAQSLTIMAVLLAMSVLVSPAVAARGDTLAIKNMNVSIWPEYDDPRVMVTYEGEFKDSSAFPAKVRFPVPMGSEVGMVCALQPPDDAHLCQLYDTAADSGSLSISYNLPIPTYYLEYYWDGIQVETDKSFGFDYISPYDIDSLEIEVQQPLNATDFRLDQPYASVRSDALGMKYYSYVFSNVTAGQEINIGAAYTKPDNKPSVTKQTSTGTAATSPSVGTNFVIIVGAAIVAVIAAFLLFRRKPAPARAHTLSRRAARIQARQASSAGSGAHFCTRCGTRLATEAAFCHACGARAVNSG